MQKNKVGRTTQISIRVKWNETVCELKITRTVF